MRLSVATAKDAGAMASVHAQAFDQVWDTETYDGYLTSPGIFGLIIWDHDPAGALLCRVTAGEAEVFAVGVAPWARRRGVARELMTSATALAHELGATEMFLEVDVGNEPAIALYEGLGFGIVGRRKDYYDRGLAGRADALVMRLDLTSAAG